MLELVNSYFTKHLNKKNFAVFGVFFSGGWGDGDESKGIFFTKNPNLKKRKRKICFSYLFNIYLFICVCVWGGV